MDLHLPPLIAHRGAPRLAPENTLASFKAAKNAGAHYIECDVMLTRDQRAVVIHDDTIDRTTNGTGAVDELTWDNLKALDAGSWFNSTFHNETIPSLAIVVATTAELELGINLELKAAQGSEMALARLVIKTLSQYWSKTLPTPLLSSFALSNLQALNTLNCRYPLGLNLENWSEDLIIPAINLNCYSIHVKQQQVTPTLVQRHRELNFKTLAYTVNDRERAEELLSMGVTSVFSDVPNLLK